MTDKVDAPEVTLESLQAALVEKDAILTTTLEKLAYEQGQLAAAQNDLTDASEVITGQAEMIKALETQVEAFQTNPSVYPTFVVNKVTYEVRTKSFQYKKLEYTVAELLKDKKLQKELVEKGVGFLVEKEV